jgi:hypothetical protein
MNDYVDPEELLARGYIQEANRQFFHPLGLALSVNEDDELNVIDNRFEVEGMYFMDGVIDSKKAASIISIQELRSRIRQLKFGFNIQPLSSSDDLVADVVKGME